MRSLISATRGDRFAENKEIEQSSTKNIQKENLDRDYIHMIENA